MEIEISRVIKALESNGMEAVFLQKREEVVPFVLRYLVEGDRVACGGSATLVECGVTEFLKNGSYEYIDPYLADCEEGRKELFARAHTARVYFSGTNAITQDGVLYNLDGRSNRIAALAYGPDKVVIVAGVNKLTKDLDTAVKRTKQIAAPLNCKRLGKKTYCAQNGRCVALEAASALNMDAGCQSSDRICCNHLVTGRQSRKNRITVVLVNENLGY